MLPRRDDHADAVGGLRDGAEFPQDVQDILWEFKFDSNEFDRQQAVRAYWYVGKLGWLKWLVVRLAGWTMFIAILLMLLWVSAWVSTLFDWLLGPHLSPDVTMIGSTLIVAVLPVLSFLGIRFVLSRRSKQKRVNSVQVVVRIHGNGDVSLLSEGTIVRRTIERLYLGDAFVFMRIDEGKRFVFVPRAMVGRDEAAAVAEFVSRRIATST